MALMNCPECSKEISDQAESCPNCGYNIKKYIAEQNKLNMTEKEKEAVENKKVYIWTFAGVAVVIGLFFFFLFGSPFGKGSDFNKMFPKADDLYFCSISSDGKAMTIDTNPFDIDDEYDYGAWNQIEVVNAKLGFNGVNERMKKTRALDGMQSETVGKYTVSWTYHPNDGLEAVYTIK